MGKVQIIKYKCCNKIFAACRLPECYEDKDWLRNLRKYALRGDIIEIVESKDMHFGKCECVKNKSQTNQPELFL